MKKDNEQTTFPDTYLMNVTAKGINLRVSSVINNPGRNQMVLEIFKGASLSHWGRKAVPLIVIPQEKAIFYVGRLNWYRNMCIWDKRGKSSDDRSALSSSVKIDKPVLLS